MRRSVSDVDAGCQYSVVSKLLTAIRSELSLGVVKVDPGIRKRLACVRMDG